ncbi:hypothetical protein [Plantactinospora sp. KLBMP9567]|nr:hypothetical protein [Plantactinospora sp. KLBMP9567]MDW5328871.1 hypothetical protein [Plantactinospora sp. KLBMP9567]
MKKKLQATVTRVVKSRVDVAYSPAASVAYSPSVSVAYAPSAK